MHNHEDDHHDDDDFMESEEGAALRRERLLDDEDAAAAHALGNMSDDEEQSESSTGSPPHKKKKMDFGEEGEDSNEAAVGGKGTTGGVIDASSSSEGSDEESDEESDEDVDDTYVNRLGSLRLLCVTKIASFINSKKAGISLLDRLPASLKSDVLQQLSFQSLYSLWLESRNGGDNNNNNNNNTNQYRELINTRIITASMKQEEDIYRFMYNKHPESNFLNKSSEVAEPATTALKKGKQVVTSGSSSSAQTSQTQYDILFDVFNADFSIFDCYNPTEARHHLFTNKDTPSQVVEEYQLVDNIDEFRKRFEAFTERRLAHINWDNVFCAGGSVLHPLRKTPIEYLRGKGRNEGKAFDKMNPKEQHSALVRHFNRSYSNADIDLFIYGLSPEKTRQKIKELVRDIRKADNDIGVTATPNTITIFDSSRAVQIIKSIYQSPAEVLLNFDLDCICVGYNGRSVLSLPKFIRSLRAEANYVDSSISLQGKLQWNRMLKYEVRGFPTALPLHIRAVSDDTFDAEVIGEKSAEVISSVIGGSDMFNRELKELPKDEDFEDYFDLDDFMWSYRNSKNIVADKTEQYLPYDIRRAIEILSLAKLEFLQRYPFHRYISKKRWEYTWVKGITYDKLRLPVLYDSTSLPEDLHISSNNGEDNVNPLEVIQNTIELNVFTLGVEVFETDQEKLDELVGYNSAQLLGQGLGAGEIVDSLEYDSREAYYLNDDKHVNDVEKLIDETALQYKRKGTFQSYVNDVIRDNQLQSITSPYEAINTMLMPIKYTYGDYEWKITDFVDSVTGKTAKSAVFEINGSAWQLAITSTLGRDYFFLTLARVSPPTGSSDSDANKNCYTNFVLTIVNQTNAKKHTYLDGSHVFSRVLTHDGSEAHTQHNKQGLLWSTYIYGARIDPLADKPASLMKLITEKWNPDGFIVDDTLIVKIEMQRMSFERATSSN